MGGSWRDDHPDGRAGGAADDYWALTVVLGSAEAAPDAWDQILRLVDSKKVAAVGETGLDRHWDYTPFPQQEDFFARHLQLARQKGLAVVIHCREAEADVVRMLREDFDRLGPIRGVMHSFTGDWATAETCIAMGLHISSLPHLPVAS